MAATTTRGDPRAWNTDTAGPKPAWLMNLGADDAIGLLPGTTPHERLETDLNRRLSQGPGFVVIRPDPDLPIEQRLTGSNSTGHLAR